MPTFTTSIEHIIRSTNHRNQTRKNKGIQIGRGEVKLSLFADDMILYTGKPNISTKNYWNQ